MLASVDIAEKHTGPFQAQSSIAPDSVRQDLDVSH